MLKTGKLEVSILLRVNFRTVAAATPFTTMDRHCSSYFIAIAFQNDGCSRSDVPDQNNSTLICTSFLVLTVQTRNLRDEGERGCTALAIGFFFLFRFGSGNVQHQLTVLH